MGFLKNWLSSKKRTKQLNEIAAQQNLTATLEENRSFLATIFKGCSDVVFHDFTIFGQISAVLIYIEGLVDKEKLDQNVLTPLLNKTGEPFSINTVSGVIPVSNIKELNYIEEIIDEISNGHPILLLDHQKKGISLGLTQLEHRAIEEPPAESVIRGPREGFTELLTINTSLLRRRIKSPQLKVKNIVVGRYTRTKIGVYYIEGIAEKSLIKEVMRRLDKIYMDGILGSGYIEELIEDQSNSLFPQILSTERPDVVVSYLLEGHVTILCDGNPVALVVPITLFSFLQSSEDYAQKFMIGSLIRWLRYISVAIVLLLPSTYVALLTYHQEMIPTSLLLTIAKSREQIPFPALFEALLMEITFEALREAGVRLPQQLGTAISIVGALVIGQAATAAGLVSSPMVMVVAITGVASFLLPHYPIGITLRILRFPIMFLAGMLGLLGIILGIIAIVIHLCSLRSFGVPYLTPIVPMVKQDLKDVLYRSPIWARNKRPHSTSKQNPIRQSPGQKPEAENEEELHSD
ncbi:spore germination protein KA [Seinonella peptonophila]|uniref:Spore germination protein KA n=1 Tax=Seinonella peptonophila TaxID=112248 RepID=A0A1M5AE87_9BACL|nr:spore germination protein [Seinonella peptonophila]SHF28222.1 spore germination protein KA [Seinonella peptonophila]